MQSERAIKFSVSFPAFLLEALDRGRGRIRRSVWLQDLATRDLKASGLLDHDPVEDEVRRLRALAASHGIEAVARKLDALGREPVLEMAEASQ